MKTKERRVRFSKACQLMKHEAELVAYNIDGLMRGVIDQTLTALLALMLEANASQVCSQCGFSTLLFLL